MTYQDRTFCGANDCQNFFKCDTALTIKVQIMAAAQNLPISQFLDPANLLSCYKRKEEPNHESHT